MTVKICLTVSLILGLFFCSLMLPKRDSVFSETQIAVETLKTEKSKNNATKAQAESLPKAIREQGIADVSRIYAQGNAQADLILARTQAYVVTWELKQKDNREHYWQFLIALIIFVAVFAVLIIAFAEYDRWTRRLDAKEHSNPGSIR